jgi:hypothetical protein
MAFKLAPAFDVNVIFFGTAVQEHHVALQPQRPAHAPAIIFPSFNGPCLSPILFFLIPLLIGCANDDARLALPYLVLPCQWLQLWNLI